MFQFIAVNTNTKFFQVRSRKITSKTHLQFGDLLILDNCPFSIFFFTMNLFLSTRLCSKSKFYYVCEVTKEDQENNNTRLLQFYLVL